MHGRAIARPMSSRTPRLYSSNSGSAPSAASWPMEVQRPPPVGEAQRGDEPFRGPGPVDGDGERAQRALGCSLDDAGAELLRDGQAAGIGVHEGHRRGPQRQRRIHGVERDRARAPRHDQHVRAGQIGEGGRHRAPAVGNVVRGARHRRGLHAVGQRDQHRRRVGHQCQIAEHPAPGTAERAEAVHRQRRHRRAAPGQPAQATRARAARDLERYDHEVAGGEGLRPLDHLGHALVSQVDRKRKGREAEDHRLVEVAGRHGQRAHDRLALVPPLRLGRVLPDHRVRTLEHQCAHVRPPRCSHGPTLARSGA